MADKSTDKKEKKPITKSRLREDTEAIYEAAMQVISDSVAGKDINKSQLTAAKMVIDYLFRLGPSPGGTADVMFQKLLGNGDKYAKMTDEELMRKPIQ